MTLDATQARQARHISEAQDLNRSVQNLSRAQAEQICPEVSSFQSSPALARHFHQEGSHLLRCAQKLSAAGRRAPRAAGVVVNGWHHRDAAANEVLDLHSQVRVPSSKCAKRQVLNVPGSAFGKNSTWYSPGLGPHMTDSLDIDDKILQTCLTCLKKAWCCQSSLTSDRSEKETSIAIDNRPTPFLPKALSDSPLTMNHLAFEQEAQQHDKDHLADHALVIGWHP